MEMYFLNLLGNPGFGTVWVCGYVSLRAISESVHHSGCRSRSSGSVKEHLGSVPNTIQWAVLSGVCKYSVIHLLCIQKTYGPHFFFENLRSVCMQTLVDVCVHLPSTHLPTLLVSVVSITVLIIAKELSNRCREKLPVPIPVELMMVSTLCLLVITYVILFSGVA